MKHISVTNDTLSRATESDKHIFLAAMAIRASIHAAIARTPLYIKAGDPKNKLIQQKWKELLNCIVTDCVSDFPNTINKYLDMVDSLYAQMNTPHIQELLLGHSFTYARAQKSVSVLLKYLWCYGFISCPESCPVDRYVLQFATKKNPQILTKKWTAINNRNELESILLTIKTAAGNQSIAEWELVHFNNNNNFSI